MQRNARSSAIRDFCVIEIGVHHALRDIVIDRGRDAASERITGVVGHAGEIKGPEAGAHNERMPRSRGFRQRKRDSSAGRRLLAERSPLDHTYGLRKSASWIESGSESKEREEKKSRSAACLCLV